jgi:hypothetical protein
LKQFVDLRFEDYCELEKICGFGEMSQEFADLLFVDFFKKRFAGPPLGLFMLS